jgi:hypothetical protein
MNEIINALRTGEFYGAGKYTDIAKGKHEIPTSIKDGLKKIKRVWQSRK